MMEMPAYYALADVALLGGSFLPFGGQNLIEAAACGCPVVMGPHTFNFTAAATLSLAAGASLRVADDPRGDRRGAGPARQRRPGAARAAALSFAAAHRGAAARAAARIVDRPQARRARRRIAPERAHSAQSQAKRDSAGPAPPSRREGSEAGRKRALIRDG